MPNKGKRFHKEHPIIVGVTISVVAGILLILFAKLFSINQQPSISQVISGSNNQVITEYTISNPSFLPAIGNTLVSPQDGEIDSVIIIKGQGKVIQLSDKKWSVQFDVSKAQDLQFRIASGNTVAVSIATKMDSSFFKRLEKLFNSSKLSTKE